MRNIPHVAYFFWNRLPMSLMQTFGIRTFHRHNPDWKIVIGLVKQLPQEMGENRYVREYRGKDYFNEIASLGYVTVEDVDIMAYGLPRDAPSIIGTDIYRTNVLYERGGVYSDHDVVWLKPMSEIVNVDHIGNINDFEATVCYYKYTHAHNNLSIMISEKGSPYMKSLIDHQLRVRPPYSDQCYSAELLNRVYPTWEAVVSKYPRMTALKYETFYPYDTYDLSPLFIGKDLTAIDNKNVMCVHWFAGNPLSQAYSTTEDFNRDCAMTELLKREQLI